MEDNYKHLGLRRQLVASIRKKGIRDNAVLNALSKIPRHLFMDSAFGQHAYQDKPFSIGEGQTISQPYTVAFQTALLQIQPGEKVLEVGTGSGYQAAVLVEMGAELYTIERNETLHHRARKLLQQLNYSCHMILGDGTKGYATKAPFHKVIVTASAPSIPKSLIEQLAIGGMLVMPVGDEYQQKMIRIRRLSEKQLQKEEHGLFNFVKLIGEQGWKR